jgi:cyclase
MFHVRGIPTLLYRSGGLVKGTQFKNHRYVGDVLNAVRIFNTKQVQELALLDIAASNGKRCISPDLVRQVSEECLMPLAVGGGVRTVEEARGLIASGAEKVIVNTHAVARLELISEIAAVLGSQAVVVSIDARLKSPGKYEVLSRGGTASTGREAVQYARDCERFGAGEILLTSVDREGTMAGYDLELVRAVASAVNVPVIAAGGAGRAEDFAEVVRESGASAFAAGSFFVFHGRRRAVLISYPSEKELERVFEQPQRERSRA